MINLIGQKFERLIVIQRMSSDRYGKARWLCRCDCGKEKVICGASLKDGRTKSCGCLHKEMTQKMGLNNTKHGHSKRGRKSRTYQSWKSIVQRCVDPKAVGYHNYGGRGITVCRRWLNFENFLNDMGERPLKHQIDRINNNGNYCKSNCHWVTSKQNNRNKRNNHLITYNKKTQCVLAWSEETGICETTIRWRLKRGWSTKQVLTTPIRKHKKYKKKRK